MIDEDDIEETSRIRLLRAYHDREQAEAELHYAWRSMFRVSVLFWIVWIVGVGLLASSDQIVAAWVVFWWLVFDVLLLIRTAIRSRRNLGYWPWRVGKKP